MNFVAQLGLLAIILIILVILIKSNQTLEQIFMEEQNRESKEQKKEEIIVEKEEQNKEQKNERDRTVERSRDTIPVEIMSGWYVEMLDGLGRSYGRVGIKSFPFTIGRACDNDYVIDDLSVSGHHACIKEEDGCLKLIDCGSLNKILFGGSPVEKVKFTNGMEICLGNTRLRFCMEEQAAPHTTPYKRNLLMEEWF